MNPRPVTAAATGTPTVSSRELSNGNVDALFSTIVTHLARKVLGAGNGTAPDGVEQP